MQSPNTLFRVAILAMAFAPAAVAAQGIDASGTVELEYSSDGNTDFALLYGDADMSYSFDGSGRGLGLDLGLTGYLGDDPFNDVAVFVALSYSTDFGKFSFGMPRNASSGMSRMPEIGGTQAVGFAQKAFLGDLPLTDYLANDDPFLGLRYDGDFGAVKTAVSAHRTRSDTNLVDAALTYTGGFLFAGGSLQYFDLDNGTDGTTLHGEIGAATDFYEAGIGVTSGDTALPDAWQAWAMYRPIDNLDLTASVLDPDGASAIWGLSAKYGVMQGGYLQGGVSDSKNADARWDVSVGFNF
ncbi:MAG: hypothetical protein LCH69_16770 [Proteobacteria bacterium]|nr:hypothetical protein [Pseudomonadota bacterium]